MGQHAKQAKMSNEDEVKPAETPVEVDDPASTSFTKLAMFDRAEFQTTDCENIILDKHLLQQSLNATAVCSRCKTGQLTLDIRTGMLCGADAPSVFSLVVKFLELLSMMQ